jgi:outer membrane protein OmpA-like peptidoglycan-associated protein
MKCKHVLISFILGILFYAFAQAEDWVPQGFEHLVDGGIETSVLDVYYRGELIAQVDAEFNDNYIQFANPYQVAYALPDTVINKEEIARVLSKKINANTNLQCDHQEKLRHFNCVPRPKVVAAALNRNLYTVSLYISPKFLKDSDKTSTQTTYLKPTTNELAYSNRFGSNILGGRDTFIYALRSIQYLSKGPYSLQMQSLYNHNSYWQGNGVSNFYIYDFSGNYMRGRDRYALGLLSTPASYFMPQENILGIQRSSTDRLRRGGRVNHATPVEIEVALPSLVSFFGNGNLLATRTYNVGMHIVDTSSFPAGAYNLEIVIEGIDGQIERKNISFLKNSAGVEPGFPEYNFTLGYNRGQGGSVFPDITNDLIMRAQYAYAYTKKLSMHLDMGYDNSFQVAIGPGFYWRAHDYIRPTIAYDLEDGLLYAATVRTQLGPVSVGGSAVKTRTSIYSDGRMYNVFTNYRNPHIGRLYASYTLSDEANLQAYIHKAFKASVGLAKPFRLNTELGINRNHRYIRLSASQLIYADKIHRGTVNSNISNDTQSDIYTNSSALNYDANYEISPDAVVSGGVRVDQNSVSLDGNIGLNREILGNRISTSFAMRQVSADRDYFFDINLSRDDNFGFFITRDGLNYTWGMEKSTGAIVELRGEFNHKDLYVNHGASRVKIHANGVSDFISIPPYSPYQIDISSDSEQSYDIRPVKEDETLVLFPGNITTVRYDVRPKFPLFAYFYCDGAPLTNQVIKSSIDTARTDEFGFASIEMIQGEPIYYPESIQNIGWLGDVVGGDRKKQNRIEFVTKKIKPRDGYAFVERMQCQVNKRVVQKAAAHDKESKSSIHAQESESRVHVKLRSEDMELKKKTGNDRITLASLESNWRPSKSEKYTILCDFDSNNFDSVHNDSLIAFSQYLKKHHNLKIHLDGFTCAMGSAEYNVALGQRRAHAVAKFLESKGVASHQIITVSYGKERPEDPAYHESAYIKNRRVELYF